MNQEKQTVRVIFRADKRDGEIVAVFPELPGNTNPYRTCLGYVHMGQHTGLALDYVSGHTRPAKPAEYKGLLEELKRIGYDVRIGKNMTWRDLDKRREACRQWG